MNELKLAGITDPQLVASYQKCKKLNSSHGKTYYLATLFLPPAKRPHVHALYGFARFADEIVDTFHAYDKVALFQQFKMDTYQALAQGISMNPILHRFQLTYHKYIIMVLS